MESAELRAWQKRLRYSDREAAAKVGLSVSGYRKQRTGAVPVGRQTAIICDLALMFEGWWLDIAETATKLTRKAIATR